MFKIGREVSKLGRRAAQQTREVVTGPMADPEFDSLYRNFRQMLDDLEDTASGVETWLVEMKSAFVTGQDLAGAMDSFWNGEFRRIWGHPMPEGLTSDRVAGLYKSNWIHVNDTARRSVAAVMLDRGVAPLRGARPALEPIVETCVRRREKDRMDYESFNRSLVEVQKKIAKIDAERANTGAAVEKRRQLETQAVMMDTRKQQAQKAFDASNHQAKDEIRRSKLQHNRLVEEVLAVLLSCQAELMACARTQLEDTVRHLGHPLDREVRDQIRNLIAQGGPGQPEEVEEEQRPSGMMRAIRVITGVETMSELRDREEAESNRRRELELEKQKRQLQEIARAANGGVLPRRPGRLVAAGPHHITRSSSAERSSASSATEARPSFGRAGSHSLSPTAASAAGRPRRAAPSLPATTKRANYTASTGSITPGARSFVKRFSSSGSGGGGGGSASSRGPRSPGGRTADGRVAPPPPAKQGLFSFSPKSGAARTPPPPPAVRPHAAAGSARASRPEDDRSVINSAAVANAKAAFSGGGGAASSATTSPTNSKGSTRGAFSFASAYFGNRSPRAGTSPRSAAAGTPSPRANAAASHGWASRASSLSPTGSSRAASPHRSPATSFAQARASPSPPPPPPRDARPAKRIIGTAVAMYENVPDEADELAFSANDVIEILAKEDDDWWLGRVRGTTREGVFPSNYVRA